MEFFDMDKLSELITTYTPKVIGAILTLLIGFWIIGIIRNVINRSLEQSGMELSLRKFLVSLASVGLKILLILSVAGMFGVETTSFIAVFGALALAIGMALQGSLGHFASGVMILFFKPYKIGDVVDIDGKIGKVEEIQIFNTVLRTPDNKKVIIPNGSVTDGVITNISGQGEIRVDMTFGIGYDDDIDQARKVIFETLNKCEHILKDKEVAVQVSELADSSVNFAVRPWARSEHYWDVYFFMHEEIKKAFDQAGIGIPYPQMDVHLQQAS